MLFKYKFLATIAAINVLRSQLAVTLRYLVEPIEKEHIVGLSFWPGLAVFVERSGSVRRVSYLKNQVTTWT